ncbi:hypothetical protein D3C78_542940 [compost metagenome]
MQDYHYIFDTTNEKTLLDFSLSDINIGKENYSCDQLLEMLANNEINLDTIFQRKKGLWSPSQKGRFIESMMLRFPIPPLYFNVLHKDEKKEFPFWEVIDGLQRLSTIDEFVHKGLELKGLEFYPELNGKKFEELPRHLIRTFKSCQLQLHLVFPNTPTQVIRRIFERINTTNLKLTDQEVRNAIYQGYITKLLKDDAIYLSNFKIPTNDNRCSTQELVLRFYSFYCFGIDKYIDTDRLDEFLDKSIRALNEFERASLDIISEKFKDAIDKSYLLLGDSAFRGVNNRFNRSLFEVITVSIANLSESEYSQAIKKSKKISNDYIKLASGKSDPRFTKSISSATSREDNVKYRYNVIKKLIEGAL